MILRDHICRQIEWSLKTFGPGPRSVGIVDHIQKELKEIAETDGKDLSEWIDVIILAIDGATREGFTPEQIEDALHAKQVVNEQRQWPDWRDAEPGKAIEHIRDMTCRVCGKKSLDKCRGCTGPDEDAGICVWESRDLCKCCKAKEADSE